MPENLSVELQVALAAVSAAARVCESVQARIRPEMLEKKDKSPVTIADYASQAIICREILCHFPTDLIVGEEDSGDLNNPENASFLDQVLIDVRQIVADATPEDVIRWIDSGNHDGASSRFWTLDPIDGTKGFLRREQYAVSLALIIDGQIALGAIACPNLAYAGQKGVIQYAIRGQGAFALPMSLSIASPARIHVSEIRDASLARLCESVESGHSSHDQSAELRSAIGLKADPVRMDSQAKYAAVAAGDAEIYLRLPTRKGYEEKIWDHAGGVIVLQEAGGTVTDLHGHPLDFSQGRSLKKNSGVVVTNGALHQTVLDALATLNFDS